MRLDVDRRTAKKHKEWEHYYGKRPLCPEGKHDKDCRDADMRARESSRRTLAAALRSPYKFRKESTFTLLRYSYIGIQVEIVSKLGIDAGSRHILANDRKIELRPGNRHEYIYPSE